MDKTLVTVPDTKFLLKEDFAPKVLGLEDQLSEFQMIMLNLRCQQSVLDDLVSRLELFK